MKCPACSSADIQSRGKRYALYPAGILAIIPLAFAMLHQASSPFDYHCNACGLDFADRNTAAKFAHVILLLAILGFILGLIRRFAAIVLVIIASR